VRARPRTFSRSQEVLTESDRLSPFELAALAAWVALAALPMAAAFSDSPCRLRLLAAVADPWCLVVMHIASSGLDEASIAPP
jgi:hypothetical protein